MIICDSFVFLHLHKSGGTFVNQLLLQCVPSACRIGYHLPYAELPTEYPRLPVIGTVRNPWSYYVSWYFFQRGQTRPNPLFLTCSAQGALGFAETISNLATLYADDARIDALAKVFPDHFVSHGLNLTKACILRLRGSGLGLYSFLYERLYRGAPAPRIARMERLREEMRAILTDYDVGRNPLWALFLDQAPSLNTSDHGPYQDYYDPPLRDLISDLDRSVILAHGYEF